MGINAGYYKETAIIETFVDLIEKLAERKDTKLE